MISITTSTFADDSDQYRKQYDAVVDNCMSVARLYQSNTSISQTTQFAIAAVGIVAGAVIAPALTAADAAKGTIAAFSGISGAVNAAQAAWSKDGLDSSSRGDAYEAFGTRVTELLGKVPYKLSDADKDNAWGNLKILQWYCVGQQPIPGHVQVSSSTQGIANLKASNQNLTTAVTLFTEAAKQTGAEKDNLLTQASDTLKKANGELLAAQANTQVLREQIGALEARLKTAQEKASDNKPPQPPVPDAPTGTQSTVPSSSTPPPVVPKTNTPPGGGL